MLPSDIIVVMHWRMLKQPNVDDLASNVKIIALLSSKSPVISVVVQTESCIIPSQDRSVKVSRLNWRGCVGVCEVGIQ